VGNHILQGIVSKCQEETMLDLIRH